MFVGRPEALAARGLFIGERRESAPATLMPFRSVPLPFHVKHRSKDILITVTNTHVPLPDEIPLYRNPHTGAVTIKRANSGERLILFERFIVRIIRRSNKSTREYQMSNIQNTLLTK